MAATIVDIAELCGYSKATVSRAFATPESVSEKARERIYAAAKELNYAPNVIARAMVRKRTENISFIIHEKQYPAVLNPFYSVVLETVMQESARHGYSIFVTTNQEMRLPSGDIYIRRHMDGVLCVGEVNRELIGEFHKQGIPVVLLNNYLEMDGLLCVTADHFHGAEAATEHLYQKGHRKIGLLAGRFSKQVSEARLSGYMKALSAHELPFQGQDVVDIDPTLEDSEQAMAEILQRPDHPTAFLCTNDTIAVGAMKAVFRAGLRVPEDIAIVGFDDSYISRVIEPELTTVRIDAEYMGRLAAQKLFDLIDGKPAETMQVEIPVQLIVRGTT